MSPFIQPLALSDNDKRAVGDLWDMRTEPSPEYWAEIIHSIKRSYFKFAEKILHRWIHVPEQRISPFVSILYKPPCHFFQTEPPLISRFLLCFSVAIPDNRKPIIFVVITLLSALKRII